MFSKLLKHELKNQAGLFGILTAAALGAGLLGSGAMWLVAKIATENQTDDYSALGAIMAMMLMMGMFFLIIAYSVAMMILLIYRFYKRHFSDEGYLTFTLPATTHQILLSSICNIAIWSIITVVVVVLAIMLIFSPMFYIFKETLGFPVEMLSLEMSAIMEEMFGSGYAVVQIFSSISSAVCGLTLPLLSVTIGSLVAKKHKLLAGFGIYYGLNMVLSMIAGALNILTTIGDYFIYEAGGETSMLLTTLITAVLYLAVGIGGYFLMHHFVDKKLNLP